MKTIILLLLAMQAGAQTIRSSPPNGIGSAQSASSFTITGSGSQCLYVSSSGATNPALMVDCANARVGIGKTAPTSKLHMSSGGFTSDGTNNFVTIGSTLVVRNGRVGINVDPPMSKLHLRIGTNLNWEFGYSGDATTSMAALNDARNAYVEGRLDGNPLALNTQSGAQVQIVSRTKAQINAITAVLGGVLICSDCAVPYSLCTGTAAVISGFRRADSTTAGCGTGN